MFAALPLGCNVPMEARAGGPSIGRRMIYTWSHIKRYITLCHLLMYVIQADTS